MMESNKFWELLLENVKLTILLGIGAAVVFFAVVFLDKLIQVSVQIYKELGSFYKQNQKLKLEIILELPEPKSNGAVESEMIYGLPDTYVSRLQSSFDAIGKLCIIGTASNPKYIEVYARCNIIEFEDCIKKAGLLPIGIGLEVYRQEDWYTAWLKPNDLLST